MTARRLCEARNRAVVLASLVQALSHSRQSAFRLGARPEIDADRPCKKMRLRAHKTLVIRRRRPYIAFTQFARACGRVPVGGHPDKRPDSRQGLEDGWRGWTSLKSRFPVSARRLLPDTDRQPEAKPANPESPRGTQLKATTERAFLVSPAFHRPAPKRLVLHCRPCGVFPNRTVFRVRTARPL